MLLAAALATAALAAPADFRTLTLDVTLTHADAWQTDTAAGEQHLRFATPRPVRQSILVYDEPGAPPIQTMTNDELVFDPPRATVRRSGCPTTRPRVRTRFAVENDELHFTVGHVPRLGEPCPPAEADLALATPEPLAFPGAARRIKRLRRNQRITLRARVQRGDCATECATTTATVKVRRVE